MAEEVQTLPPVIFWAYDLFPFVLGGETKGEPTIQNTEDEGARASYMIPSYGRRFTARHIMDNEPGKEVLEKLKALERERDVELGKVKAEFRRKALELAPWLKDFPAYKNK